MNVASRIRKGGSRQTVRHPLCELRQFRWLLPDSYLELGHPEQVVVYPGNLLPDPVDLLHRTLHRELVKEFLHLLTQFLAIRVGSTPGLEQLPEPLPAQKEVKIAPQEIVA